jgi:uncharacterized protein DUF3551
VIIPRNNASDANAAGSFTTDLTMTSSPEQSTNIVPYLFGAVKGCCPWRHDWRTTEESASRRCLLLQTAKEFAMRTIAVAATTAALVLLSAGSSQARQYAFCATYDDTGARNCGFDTMEQCRAAVSGCGGFCSVNPAYQAGLSSASRRPPRGR